MDEGNSKVGEPTSDERRGTPRCLTSGLRFARFYARLSLVPGHIRFFFYAATINLALELITDMYARARKRRYKTHPPMPSGKKPVPSHGSVARAP